MKRYVREPGAVAVRRLLKADAGAASRLSEVEVASALVRRAREGAFTVEERDRALASLADDLATLIIVEFTPGDYGGCASPPAPPPPAGR